ncbi:MAG TPA: 50S ribosomal protein L9 [Dehalococcoidia bacterium]|jgi:large subunit ribosomal protein L9|nr:50S ribosomal protein L9 [Dehalococcoidia bacterium]
MRVVFLEEVEGTARTGDVKNVSDGFARNYLLPRKLAAPATNHYITIATAKATKEARRQAKLDEDAQKLVPQIDGKSITIEVRVGEQDKLFGSVTTRDIAEQLTQLTKIELEHRQIDLKQPLRELGAHPVRVKLTRNVVATVTVNVEPIGGLPAAAAEAEEAPAPAAEEIAAPEAEEEVAEEAPAEAEETAEA